MEIKVKNNKRVRGYILKALNMMYPSPASLESLQSSMLSTLLTESLDIYPHVKYLEDKGYISLKTIESDYGLRLVYVKLTSRGIDVLERTIQDAGVIIDG